MGKNYYSVLRKELPIIARIVKQFPESTQQKVFELLISSITDKSIEYAPHIENSHFNARATSNLSGIAEQRGNEVFFVFSDLKAKNRFDALERLVFVVLYSYDLLGKTPVSRKNVLNKLLTRWGLNTGTDRTRLANMSAILKEGQSKDMYSLSEPAKQTAKEYITQILDPAIKGKWSTSKVKKRGQKSKK